VKWIVGISIGLREVSDWTLWRVSHLQNERRDYLRAPTTLGTFACTKYKRKLMVHLDQLAPSREERPKEGAAGAVGEVITVRAEPRGRKVRPVTDVTSTALRKEEMVVRIRRGQYSM
jgi:hypothetical protein